jgi:PAS domain S-box-containing protein
LNKLYARLRPWHFERKLSHRTGTVMEARQKSEGNFDDDNQGHDDAGRVELLRELEQRVRLLETTLSHIPDFAYAFDREGRFVYVNRALLDLWGLRLEEAVGKNFFDLKYPDELAAKLQRQIQVVFDSGQGLTDETPYTSPLGKGGYYEYIFRPVLGQDGTVELVAGSTRDITGHKQMEASLKKGEQLLRHLIQNIPGGSLNVLDKDLRYLFAEGQGLARVGLSTENLVGKTLSELFPTEAVDFVTPYYRRALAGEAVDFELEVGGQWFIINTAPLKDEHGQVNAAIALAQDITERKRAENERERLLLSLDLERSRLAYLFTHAPALVAVLRGPEHVFELVNPPYMLLIGGRDVKGLKVREALPEVEGQGYFEMLDKVYQTGEPHIGREMKVMLGRGQAGAMEESFINFVYQPIYEADRSVSGVFVHGIDVTVQVRAREEAEAANRLKDEFLATLSHELRTPLTAVLGWARMLRGGELDESAAHRALEIIERNAEAQQQLIEDVLDVSRIVTGKLRLDLRPVELLPLVLAAVDAVSPAAEAKNIQLSVNAAPEANLVSADPSRLQQVFWNLLTNAIKFTPKGGKVEVGLERAGESVRVSVSDTGVGIAKEFLPHVFDRFRQAESTSSRHYSGLGLGLAVVRHLVEQHGGTVSAESRGANQGSTFTIELPLLVHNWNGSELERQNKGEHARRVDSSDSLKGVRALIVEDESDTRELLAVLLRQHGAQVTTSGAAAEALAALRHEPPDVLLSDIGMPGEDGYWLIKQVRGLEAERGGMVPAVALTAYSTEADRERALAAGFQAYVSKPIESAALINAVADVARRPRKLPLDNKRS